MKNREEAYIGIELETHIYGDDLGSAGMDDILMEGIDITADELYQFIYFNGYNCEEEHLKMMLDEHTNDKNMLYPLECIYDRETSYEDWLEYKKEKDDWFDAEAKREDAELKLKIKGMK